MSRHLPGSPGLAAFDAFMADAVLALAPTVACPAVAEGQSAARDVASGEAVE